MFKKYSSLMLVLLLMFSVSGCRDGVVDRVGSKAIEVTKNAKGEIVVIENDELAIYLKDKVSTPLGMAINVRVENRGNNTIVIQSKGVKVGTIETSPIFSVGLKSRDGVGVGKECIVPMTFIGVEKENALKNIKGLFTVNSEDFTANLGEFVFRME